MRLRLPWVVLISQLKEIGTTNVYVICDPIDCRVLGVAYDCPSYSQCPGVRHSRWSYAVRHNGLRSLIDGVHMASRIKMVEVVLREGVSNVVMVPTQGKPKFAFRSANRQEALNVAKAYARQYGVLIHYSEDTWAFPDGRPIGDPDNTDPEEVN